MKLFAMYKFQKKKKKIRLSYYQNTLIAYTQKCYEASVKILSHNYENHVF